VERNGRKGTKIVAGGGKYTVRFDEVKHAIDAKDDLIEAISTTLPMLEFQYSDIVEANSFRDAINKDIISKLDQQKRLYRGYGLSFNPHLMLCSECGEYPTVKDLSKDSFCRICGMAHKVAMRPLTEKTSKSTIENIYSTFFDKRNDLIIPFNFDDLFEDKINKLGNNEVIPRMAIWFSDLNNMNQKIPIWLDQKDDDIIETFKNVTEINVTIITETLRETFNGITSGNIPFRLIIAGGDDLCIVMDEAYILNFCLNYSRIFKKKIETLPVDHPLHIKSLTNRNKKKGKPIKPYCFGASFVITPIHTPFKKIQEAGETLMGLAKKKTDRQDNSINWMVMSAETEPIAEKIIPFEKPLLIEKEYDGKLSFRTYCSMRDFYSGLIRDSQVQSMIACIIDAGGDNGMVEDYFVRIAYKDTGKIYRHILADHRFRKNGHFCADRLATLLELLGIEKR
jgi:hypothetical protein